LLDDNRLTVQFNLVVLDSLERLEGDLDVLRGLSLEVAHGGEKFELLLFAGVPVEADRLIAVVSELERQRLLFADDAVPDT
jgi:hypothetical protein